jgi:hypothetical protein
MKTELNEKKEGFSPSVEWFENYRFYSIDYHILETIYETIIESTIPQIEDCLDDLEFLQQNFPSYTTNEMEEFIEYDYLVKSTFIKNLQIFISNERKRITNIKNGFSIQEKKWLEENID